VGPLIQANPLTTKLLLSTDGVPNPPPFFTRISEVLDFYVICPVIASPRSSMVKRFTNSFSIFPVAFLVRETGFPPLTFLCFPPSLSLSLRSWPFTPFFPILHPFRRVFLSVTPSLSASPLLHSFLTDFFLLRSFAREFRVFRGLFFFSLKPQAAFFVLAKSDTDFFPCLFFLFFVPSNAPHFFVSFQSPLGPVFDISLFSSSFVKRAFLR